MKTQIIEKQGKREFVVIPYRDFLRLQKELSDYHDLITLREAKSDPRNKRGRPFDQVASELGLKRNTT